MFERTTDHLLKAGSWQKGLLALAGRALRYVHRSQAVLRSPHDLDRRVPSGFEGGGVPDPEERDHVVGSFRMESVRERLRDRGARRAVAEDAKGIVGKKPGNYPAPAGVSAAKGGVSLAENKCVRQHTPTVRHRLPLSPP